MFACFAAKVAKSNRLDDFIGLHQNLFRLFAVAGFINTLFERLVTICEDDSEQPYLREAAHFWATQIADGFILFKQFKRVYKSKKEKVSKRITIFLKDLASFTETDFANVHVIQIRSQSTNYFSKVLET